LQGDVYDRAAVLILEQMRKITAVRPTNSPVAPEPRQLSLKVVLCCQERSGFRPWRESKIGHLASKSVIDKVLDSVGRRSKWQISNARFQISKFPISKLTTANAAVHGPKARSIFGGRCYP
jgi:hypothetical protein